MKNFSKLLILATIVSALSATTTHYIVESFISNDHKNFIGIVKKGTNEQDVTKPGSGLQGIYVWSGNKWQQLRNADHPDGTLPELSPDLIKEINPFLQSAKSESAAKTPPIPPPSRQDPFGDPVQYVKRKRGKAPDPPIKAKAVNA
ncbi:hypothetical protein DdX_20176 [Ditylenchus destructor]|uniref:Uncharacterized protein n=1 Tax=Ditylenchus destructor TaxID=166010 RepID=A0AAD4MIF7_9BILA|nr:hypothetical protein DdX_20176 [Ditylenchus destructor]